MSEADPGEAVTRRYAEHVNPSLVQLLGALGFGRVFVRASGCTLWDARGRAYLDFLAAFGAVPLGHNHEGLREALHRALDEDLAHLVHTGPQPKSADLAFALAERMPELPVALLSLSGSDAVESAIKLARSATRRAGILCCEGGFHGLGLGALSIVGPSRFREPVEPLLPGVSRVPFGDLGAAEQALRSRSFAIFLLEPILAEGGVVLPPEGYLREVAALCRKHGTVFALDEVQTGLGRTGTLFACQREAVIPDVLVIGKALGGGLLPVSAAMTTRDWHQRAFSGERFDLHGSTYAGYALGSALGLAVLEAIDTQGLVARADSLGARLRDGLGRRLDGHPFVKEVRGRGLLVGIELGPTGSGLLSRLAPGAVAALSERAFGQWVALCLLELPRPILMQPASQRWNVLRLEPPLTVEPADIDYAIEAVGGVLDRYRDLGPLLSDLTARLGRQWWNGGMFG